MKLFPIVAILLSLAPFVVPAVGASAHACPNLAASSWTVGQQSGPGGTVVGTVSALVPNPVPVGVPILTCPGGYTFESTAANCTKVGVEAGVFCGPSIPSGRTAKCIVDITNNTLRFALVLAFDIDGDGQVNALSGESSTGLLHLPEYRWQITNPYNQAASILAFPTTTTNQTYANDRTYLNCWLA